MKLWIQSNNLNEVKTVRIDDVYLGVVIYSTKSFIAPLNISCLKAGDCYDIQYGNEYKIRQVTELTSTDNDVKHFAFLIQKLEELPLWQNKKDKSGFVIDALRKDADVIAKNKKHMDPENRFWRCKTLYWPWYLEKRIQELNL